MPPEDCLLMCGSLFFLFLAAWIWFADETTQARSAQAARAAQNADSRGSFLIVSSRSMMMYIGGFGAFVGSFIFMMVTGNLGQVFGLGEDQQVLSLGEDAVGSQEFLRLREEVTLRIDAAGDECLSLAEVEAFDLDGRRIEPTAVAMGSEQSPDLAAQNCVDRRYSTACSTECRAGANWLVIVYAPDRRVGAVKVRNRAGAGQESIDGATIELMKGANSLWSASFTGVHEAYSFEQEAITSRPQQRKFRMPTPPRDEWQDDRGWYFKELFKSLRQEDEASADGDYVSFSQLSEELNPVRSYNTFRIPCFVTVPERSGRAGMTFAFVEGRRHSHEDSGAIDLVMRRGDAEGRAWGPLELAVEPSLLAQQAYFTMGEYSFGALTVGNPTAVYDAGTDRLVLLFNTMLAAENENDIICGSSSYKRHTHVLQSTGANLTRFTWDAPPRDITAAVMLPEWRWYAVGPGAALQLRSGRLIVPSNHALPWFDDGGCTDVRSKHEAHVIFSDDAGDTWKIGGIAVMETSEGALAQLEDGSVVFNMRGWNQEGSRVVQTSVDDGLTWGAPRIPAGLTQPRRFFGCHGALLAVRCGDDQRERLLYSGPAGRENRFGLALQLMDAGEGARAGAWLNSSAPSWERWDSDHVAHGRLLDLWPAAAGYSSMQRVGSTGGYKVGVLFEAGDRDPVKVARVLLAVGDPCSGVPGVRV